MGQTDNLDKMNSLNLLIKILIPFSGRWSTSGDNVNTEESYLSSTKKKKDREGSSLFFSLFFFKSLEP